MEFTLSERTRGLHAELAAFMDAQVYPAEARYGREVAAAAAAGDPHRHPPVLEELKAEARRRGLWNLFLPDAEFGAGLTNLEYAPLAELTGRSFLAPEAVNCSAPDSGNMEILAQFGTEAQRRRWLHPLLEGEIRSCFAMTEPDVASSDATQIASTIERVGDEYVLNGRKWWSSGAMRDRCAVAIFLGRSDPDAQRHRQHSMVLVPMDAPGLRRVRNLSVFGYIDMEGHAELEFSDVRVPVANLLGEQGGGFSIAQARLGPGRVHHCMRAIGAAERAFDLLCARAHERHPFGRPLAEQGVIQQWVADSRIEIEQARLLTLKAAWLMDTAGNKGARMEIAAIKVAVPAMALRVVDRAIQSYGGAGVSQDTPLPAMYAWLRCLRIADGPDEVHRGALGRAELRRYAPPTP